MHARHPMPIVLALLLTAAFPAAAQAPADPRAVEAPAKVAEKNIHTWALAETALTEPALKYRFVLSPVDAADGNAAPIYLTALTLMPADRQADDGQLVKLLEAPLADLSAQAVGEALEPYSGALRQMGFAAVLPPLNQFRTLARALALRARMHIAAGDFAAAAADLRRGYQLARHLGNGELLIQALVGIAVSGQMTGQVEAWIARGGSPNLYWALAQIHDGVVDFRRAFRTEADVVFLSMPQLRKLEELELSAEGWRALVNQTLGLFGTPQPPMAAAAWATAAYPQARRWLLDNGYSEKQVEAMPVGKAILLTTVANFTRQRDDLFKWLELPYHLAARGMQASMTQLRSGTADMSPVSGYPLVYLLPALSRASFIEAKGQRRVAALMAAESIRAWRAAHKGAWPESLDVLDWPAPHDPVTGKPFPYRVEDGKAILESPAPYFPDDSERFILLAPKAN